MSCPKDGLLPLNQHALGVIGDIAYHSYEGAATRLDERERILADLDDRSILVLRNHGLLTVGHSIGEAFVVTYRVERACAMQFAFQQSGAEFFPIRDAVVQHAYARAKDGFAGGGRNDLATFEWPAFLRKLDRIDRSYKQ